MTALSSMESPETQGPSVGSGEQSAARMAPHGLTMTGGESAHEGDAYPMGGGGMAAFYDGPKGIQAKGNKGDVSGPQVSYRDLSPEQQQRLEKAVTAARSYVNKALSAVAEAKTKPSPLVSFYFKIKGTSADDQKALDTVLSKYRQIASALSGKLSMKGEQNQKPNKNGSVTLAWVQTGILADGDIHICYPYFDSQLDDVGRASTIIHEVSHKYAGTDDNAYSHETAKFNNMSQKDAINNAESYGDFAVKC